MRRSTLVAGKVALIGPADWPDKRGEAGVLAGVLDSGLGLAFRRFCGLPRAAAAPRRAFRIRRGVDPGTRYA
ncbi:MAG: hypothetical protein ABL962_13795, partial [Fimbriimonadaceae bacterium]